MRHEHATYNRRQDAAAMNLTHDGLRQSCSDLDYRQRLPSLELPDDDNDAVKYVVRVPDVSEQAEGEQHETHLQDKHAGENDVTDLQDVSQLLGLDRTAQQKEKELICLLLPRAEKKSVRVHGHKRLLVTGSERSAASKASSQVFHRKGSTLELSLMHSCVCHIMMYVTDQEPQSGPWILLHGLLPRAKVSHGIPEHTISSIILLFLSSVQPGSLKIKAGPKSGLI